MTDVPRERYVRALDEIYELRRLLAYEAERTEADLSLKSFPASRRRFAEEGIERMRSAARGNVFRVIGGLQGVSLRWARHTAGAKATMTLGQWERQRGFNSSPSEGGS